MLKQINLFEFVKYPYTTLREEYGIVDIDQFVNELDSVLNIIWENRKQFIPIIPSEQLENDSKSKTQRFIDFRKNDMFPRNYLGTIHFKCNEIEYIVNLLPKIFYKEQHSYSLNEIDSIFVHILWWLTGSEKQNYDTLESSLGGLESNFLEILVSIFATYTLDVLATTSYNYYETINEEVESVKGQIDFGSYIKNYANGNRHKLPCTYDSLQYDNQFNRIVKYVASILKDFTKHKNTYKNLEEILFILDEVEYINVTIEDCDKVVLNPIYTEFKTILDNCRMFLSSLSVYKWKDDYNVFALLIPSEKLFENFIFTTLKENKSTLIKKVSRTRPGKSHLVKQLPNMTPRFKMINDIVVKLNDNSHILIDTKYKKVFNSLISEEDDIDPNYNILQSDIYQMVSYAIGSGISDISLIYPKQYNDVITELPIYAIDDAFANDVVIKIYPFKVDIMHEDGLQMHIDGKLEDLFFNTKERLVIELNSIVEKINLSKKDI